MYDPGGVHLRINESAFAHPKLRAVWDYVHEHIADAGGSTLEQVAAIARLSPKSFSDFFRQRVEVPFSVWRDWTRIQRAKRIFVGNPWRRVEAVGAAVGYLDCTTFGRAFKRYEGITPVQFREIARGAMGLSPATSSRARRKLIDSVTHLARVTPATVPLLIDLANMMHRLSDSS